MSDTEPMFESCDAWVSDWLLLTYVRSTSTVRVWCPEWRQHPEAVERLTALWQAWEEAAVSESRSAMSHWWLDHLDRHMAVLMDPVGPLQGCSPTRGHSDHGR